MIAAPVLIVGAGPTGLAAALFLKRAGVDVRIVEALAEPIATSKALGVNPRTLEMLRPTGVSQAILQEALPFPALCVHQDGRFLAELRLNLSELGAADPMVILPQSRTEALLARALAEQGVRIERGVSFAALEQDEAGVLATLLHDEGEVEETSFAILLGADGSHSPVRHALGVGFPGSAMPQDWRLIDLELEGPDAARGAWADFQREGPVVALPFSRTVWRLIGFGGRLLERLPGEWKIGEVRWESGFRVSHRLADAFTVGHVCLAGDAAHIHSPIGARGMNLGIEDAYIFAACATRFLKGETGALEAYGRSRRQIDGEVVRRVETLTRGIAAVGPAARLLRPMLAPLIARIPALRHVGVRAATGLDHALVFP